MANIIRGTYAALLFDVHVPHHDRPALNIALSVMEDTKPKHIHIPGDFYDCPQISSHLKDIARMSRFKEDRQAGGAVLDRIQATSPNATIDWEEGNHEERWKRYILTQAHEISDLPELSAENVFNLKSRNIRYHKYMEPVDQWGVKIVHGNIARNISGATSRAMLAKYGCTGVSGHAHRREQVMHRSFNETNEWHTSGCLCTLNPEYTSNPNWNHGFVLLYMMKHYRRAHILPVAIIDGQAVVNGRGYEFEDAIA